MNPPTVNGVAGVLFAMLYRVHSPVTLLPRSRLELHVIEYDVLFTRIQHLEKTEPREIGGLEDRGTHQDFRSIPDEPISGHTLNVPSFRAVGQIAPRP